MQPQTHKHKHNHFAKIDWQMAGAICNVNENARARERRQFGVYDRSGKAHSVQPTVYDSSDKEHVISTALELAGALLCCSKSNFTLLWPSMLIRIRHFYANVRELCLNRELQQHWTLGRWRWCSGNVPYSNQRHTTAHWAHKFICSVIHSFIHCWPHFTEKGRAK